MSKGIPAKFSDREVALMIEWRKQGVIARVIAERLGARFHRKTSENVINRKLLMLGYPGINRQFAKGSTPWNKGVKGYMGANATSFKKGQLPPSTRQVGETRLDKEGAVLVKVAHRKWVRRSRLEWEKHHGPLPKGHIIFHINGDIKDDRIENLELLSRAENLALKRKRWEKDKPRYDELDDSLKPTAILIAKLSVKANEKKTGDAQ